MVMNMMAMELVRKILYLFVDDKIIIIWLRYRNSLLYIQYLPKSRCSVY